MSEVDFKSMANVDLVAYAREQGHNVRGMNRAGIMDLLTVTPPQSIALPDNEATLCAKRSCPNRITVKVVGSVQTVLAPKQPTTVAEVIAEKGSWAQIRAKAKELGISTYRKNRAQVEAEIKEIEK